MTERELYDMLNRLAVFRLPGGAAGTKVYDLMSRRVIAQLGDGLWDACMAAVPAALLIGWRATR
jgi:hypothetical protein